MVAFTDIGLVRQGQAALGVEVVAGESTVTSAYATNPMKLLTPCARGQSVWACTSSFGGGLVAGDQTQLDLRIGTDARCFVGTQASTKVYRNPSRLPSGHITRATIGENAALIFAPDPVQAFADSTYTQRQEFHLAANSGLVFVDWFTSGRAARGERWAFHRWQSRNEVWRRNEPCTREKENRPPSQCKTGLDDCSVSVETRRSGQELFPLPEGEGQGEGKWITEPVEDLIFLDSLLLNSSAPLASPHVTGRFNCFALLLFIGPPVREFATNLLEGISHRPVERQSQMISSASPIHDGALLRVAGENVELVGRELHRNLQPLSALLGDDPWARKW